jgi:hypothetical protein
MKKFKLSLVACYTLLTFFLPFALVVLCWVMIANRASEWNVVWRVVEHTLFSLILPVPYLLVPVGVNLVLGPSIIAYLSHKQSRAIILILNLILVGWLWRIKDIPGDVLGWSAWLPFGLMVLLCAWACWERASASAADSTSTVVILMIVHVCAIGWVYYGLYKSPEQRVAEEMLKHRTIKWEHNGKIEYFCTYDPETPAGYGYTDSGLYYTESASTGLFDQDGAYRTGPVSTGAFDRNGNFKGHKRYSIWFYNDRLIINSEDSGERIRISYEQLFKSKDIELIDSHTKPNLRSAALGTFAFPGYSLPGQYGWQYNADFAPDSAFRYAWDDYFNGVHYSGYVDSENKLYVNTYGDHGENLDSFLFAGWLDGNGANGTFTHSHDWSQDSSWPHHIRSFSQTYLFGKAVEMPKGWQDLGMIPRDLGMIPEGPAKH